MLTEVHADTPAVADLDAMGGRFCSSNLRGRAFRVYDGVGLMQSDAFDFAGNLVSQTRRLTVAYDETPSWSSVDGLTDLGDLDTAAASLLEAETFTTTATFDALGRPVTQTTPDASVLHLGYDDGGKLYAVDGNIRGAVTPTDFVTAIEYDARGQRQRIDYGNGTRTDYEHDPRTFRLRRLHTTNTAGTVVHQDLRYTFDPVGNITEIRDLAQPVVFTHNAAVSADQRFTYDALYRLVQAEGREHGSQGQPVADDFIPRAAPDDPTGLRAYVESYAYDLVGNILQLQHQAPGGNWTRHYQYAASGNRVLATSAPGDGPGVFSHAFAYDAHGSMTAMPHLAAVEWDHADRMQSADLGGGGTVWLLYDSAGNRVRKIRVNQAGTSTYERIYLGGYEVYRERVGTELRLERQTLHVADDTGRICLVETKTIDDGDVVPLPANISRYQYGNHLGSVGMELNETGQLISYEEFHPYGTSAYRAVNSAVDVSPSRYRYTGKERDEETGLGHHGARYYASWLGRWTAADPIGLGDGINRFAYAHDRPTSLGDPSGTRAVPDFANMSAAEFKEYQRRAHADPASWEDQAPKPKKQRAPRSTDAVEPDRQSDLPYRPDFSGDEALARARGETAERDAKQYDANRKVAAAVTASGDSFAPLAEFAAGFTPLGLVLDVRDLAKAIVAGSLVGIAASALGFVPAVGDFIKFGRGLFRGVGDDAIDAGADVLRHTDDAPSTPGAAKHDSTAPEGAGDAVADTAGKRAKEGKWDTPENWATKDHGELRDRLRKEYEGFESGRHNEYPKAMRRELLRLADDADARGDLPEYGQRLREIAETYRKREGSAHRGGR